MIGTLFTYQRHQYKVTEYVPSRPKYPYTVARQPDGKLFKFPAHIVTGTPQIVIPVMTESPTTSMKEQALWSLYAKQFNLPSDAFGKTFTTKGTEYRITGIKPNRPKFPVEAVRVRDNAPFKFTSGIVASLLTTTSTTVTHSLKVGQSISYLTKGWSDTTEKTYTGVVTLVRADEVEIYGSGMFAPGKVMKATAVTPISKRADADILRDISGVYNRLSPESLTADGERPRSQVIALSAILNRALKALQIELGRTVSEEESYA